MQLLFSAHQRRQRHSRLARKDGGCLKDANCVSRSLLRRNQAMGEPGRCRTSWDERTARAMTNMTAVKAAVTAQTARRAPQALHASIGVNPANSVSPLSRFLIGFLILGRVTIAQKVGGWVRFPLEDCSTLDRLNEV
jgi:hypothetical protein